MISTTLEGGAAVPALLPLFEDVVSLVRVLDEEFSYARLEELDVRDSVVDEVLGLSYAASRLRDVSESEDLELE